MSNNGEANRPPSLMDIAYTGTIMVKAVAGLLEKNLEDQGAVSVFSWLGLQAGSSSSSRALIAYDGGDNAAGSSVPAIQAGPAIQSVPAIQAVQAHPADPDVPDTVEVVVTSRNVASTSQIKVRDDDCMIVDRDDTHKECTSHRALGKNIMSYLPDDSEEELPDDSEEEDFAPAGSNGKHGDVPTHSTVPVVVDNNASGSGKKNPPKPKIPWEQGLKKLEELRDSYHAATNAKDRSTFRRDLWRLANKPFDGELEPYGGDAKNGCPRKTRLEFKARYEDVETRYENLKAFLKKAEKENESAIKAAKVKHVQNPEKGDKARDRATLADSVLKAAKNSYTEARAECKQFRKDKKAQKEANGSEEEASGSKKRTKGSDEASRKKPRVSADDEREQRLLHFKGLSALMLYINGHKKFEEILPNSELRNYVLAEMQGIVRGGATKGDLKSRQQIPDKEIKRFAGILNMVRGQFKPKFRLFVRKLCDEVLEEHPSVKDFEDAAPCLEFFQEFESKYTAHFPGK